MLDGKSGIIKRFEGDTLSASTIPSLNSLIHERILAMNFAVYLICFQWDCSVAVMSVVSAP